MSPETARWLLTGAHAFQKDNQLQEWEGVSRENFISLLVSIFETEAFETEAFKEAVRRLEQIVFEKLSAPDLPPNLKLLVEEWEKAQEKEQIIRQQAGQKVQEFFERQKRLAAQKIKPKIKPILPLAGPVAEGISRETPPRVPQRPEETLPSEIVEKLAAEDEGVAFTPIFTIFTILQPKVAASVIKKAVLATPVKILQVLDKISGEELTGEAVPEWREMLHQGLTSKDIDASVLAYQEAGVSPEHPIVKNLEAKRTRVKAYEQSHRLISGILKHYHEFTKITGRRQIFLPEIKTFLPRLAQLSVWAKKQGYSWGVRQGLNKLGFVFRTHEKISLGPEKTVVRFTLPDKITRLASLGRVKTFGRAILTRLGKTALGQGIKKGAAWVLTRLGLAAIPTGVTLALALIAKDALKIGFKFLKGFFKKLWDNPLLAGILGAGLLLLPLLLTLPFLLIPILVVVGAILLGSAILSGAAQVGGAIISSVGSFLGGVASSVGGFLSSLSTISIPSTLPMIAAVGAPAAVGILTTIVILNTSAAFVEKPTTTVGIPVPYGACSLTPDTTRSNALKELFINAGQWAGVPPAILAGVASIEGGHLFGYSDQQIQQFSAPGAQDPKNCQPNGCGARGPMQFLNDGVATDCGRYTGQVMPDVWGAYKGAVNQAIPAESRTPEVCNIKDSIYAAAWKIKTDSGTTAEQTCVWTQEIVNRVAKAYYGDEIACTKEYARLGNKTYCQYLWDYYQAHNVVKTPESSGWFFWQGNLSWRDYSGGFRCGTIGTHGCGPTSLAMVLKKFGVETTPPQVWDEFLQRYAMTCQGTTNYESVFIELPKTLGMTDARGISANWTEVENYLKNGYLIIANTTQFGGHFIVIRGIDGNNVIVNDPNYSSGDGMVYTKSGMPDTTWTWKGNVWWAIKK